MRTMKFKFAELKAESAFDQMEKIREKFLEFSTATCCTERIEEAFYLMQAIATFLCFVCEEDIKLQNKRHLAKMKKILAD